MKRIDRGNPYRIMFGVLDKRCNQQIISFKNFSLKEFETAFKEVKKKLK